MWATFVQLKQTQTETKLEWMALCCLCLVPLLQLSLILFLKMAHQEHYHQDDLIYLLVSVRLSFHQIVDVSMIACPNLYLPSWCDNTNLPHVSMIACPNYIFPLGTITPISPRAIPEQGNRAEVVLVVLHRWSVETFCMMYNLHCTCSCGLFKAFCMWLCIPWRHCEWGPFFV